MRIQTNSSVGHFNEAVGDASNWSVAERKSPNMKPGGYSNPLRDQKQTVREGCQEALPGPENWAPGDLLANRASLSARGKRGGTRMRGGGAQILTSGRCEREEKHYQEKQSLETNPHQEEKEPFYVSPLKVFDSALKKNRV